VTVAILFLPPFVTALTVLLVGLVLDRRMARRWEMLLAAVERSRDKTLH
jgi:hypothetical protein